MIPEYHKIRPILLIGQHDAPPVKGKRGLDSDASRRAAAGDGGDYGTGGSGGDGGGGGGDGTSPSVKIYGSLDPLPLSASRSFVALVTPIADQRVTWTCTVGTITTNGLYTAPNALPEDPLVHVRAESVAFPGVFDEVTFLLSESLSRISLRLVNTCGEMPVGGGASFWNVREGSIENHTALQEVAGGATNTQLSDQTLDAELVTLVQAHVVFTGVRYNGQSSITISATKLSDTLYEVDLCDPDPVWTYFNTEQSYTATCGNFTYGYPVTVTKAAGTYSSTVSVAAANAAALEAATAQALAALVCTVPQLVLEVDAIDAQGGIRLRAQVADWRGNATWRITIGRTTGNIDDGVWIRDTEFGTPYLAELLTYTLPDPALVDPPGFSPGDVTQIVKDFYLDRIDPQWLIGNEDGDTWLIDVEIRVTLTDPNPDFVKTLVWKKYLLV